MSDGNLTAAGPRWLLPARWFRRWKLWEVARNARVLILVVDLAGIAGLAAAMLGFHANGTYIGRWLLIIGLSVLHLELTGRVERMRLYLTTSAYVTMTSVWAFSAVLTLPVGYASSLVAVLFCFLSWQRSRQHKMIPHRDIFNGAVAVLAALLAGAVQN